MKIGIVGGGASGCYACIRILESLKDRVGEVVLFEPLELGAGIAYLSDRDDLLLNVPAQKMGIEDFLKKNYPEQLKSEHYPFVARKFFRLYLQDRLKNATLEPHPSKLTLVREKVTGIQHKGGQWEIQTTQGALGFKVDGVILATGYQEKSKWPDAVLSSNYTAIQALTHTSKVLILGTKLSAIDTWLVLQSRFTAKSPPYKIDFLSIHGQFPLTHKMNSASSGLSPRFKKIPDWVGMSPHQILKSLRAFHSCEVSWSELADQVRLQAQQIWVVWSKSEREQFARHLKSHWDLIRHRVPETVFKKIQQGLDQGNLRNLRGRVISISREKEFSVATYYSPQLSRVVQEQYDIIIDATGAAVDETLGQPPNHLAHVRVSGHGLGYMNLGAPHFWAIGPASRLTFWEISAMPDIFVQIENLIQELKTKNHRSWVQDSLSVHPNHFKEGYVAHFLRSNQTALFYLKLSFASVVHSVFPFLFTDYVSNQTRILVRKIGFVLRRRVK